MRPVTSAGVLDGRYQGWPDVGSDTQPLVQFATPLGLLERQFLVDNPRYPLGLQSALTFVA